MSATQTSANITPSSNRLVSQKLEGIFASCFLERYQTRLVGGASEPLYEPAASQNGLHTLYYREDFFASALHEISHWCLAGEQRRLLRDYGYWYSPDGRDRLEQRQFEQVEVKPQALEWALSKACGYSFRVSVDNLNGTVTENDNDLTFSRSIYAQLKQWSVDGLPLRGLTFFQALGECYGHTAVFDIQEFSLKELDWMEWSA